MTYVINLKHSAEKELKKLPEVIHDRIVERLLLLKNNPRPQRVKKIRGSEGYRIRVGEYRVLYTINDEAGKVEIYSIAHRREAYRF
jgi:mRNA interferase RelE/StbE